MLEVQEILELERRWRVYDKERKNSRCGKNKKYQTYMLVALLAASVTTASLVFFYFDDLSMNVAKNTSSNYEIKNSSHQSIKLEPTNNNTIVNDAATANTQNDTSQNLVIAENPESETQQNPDVIAGNNEPTQDLQEANVDIVAKDTSKEITNIRQQVLFTAPVEEKINLGAENVNLKNSGTEAQKGFKFEIQSSNLDISVDELKTKFDKNNSSDLAVLIAKKYYDIEDYKSSEKWALIANELNSDNEESWVIFAKSKYNLGQKYDAVKVLRIYNDKANSKEIEELIKHIESNAI